MGKPTGFLEYTRKPIPNRPPLERVKDWDEIHEHADEAAVSEQAARCMDCGTPYCHTGMNLKGMASGCPINNLIPEFNDLVYKGDWHEAYLRLIKTNNFPEFTGRVCPAPCEGSCVLGVIEPPVTIKNIECAIIDRAWEEGWVVPNPPKSRTGKTVAVVGSGPAGLAAADQLNQAGHTVTLFERADRMGGLLMYGIPNMKLEKDIVARRIKLMEDEGVIMKPGMEIGRDMDPNQLTKDFDAVVLCCGATKPRNLPIPGRDLKNIHFAMEFLGPNTRELWDVKEGKSEQFTRLAKDKHVVIIGGGDTGTDCVGTSLRHGCKSVIQLEIMPKPPMEREITNPWPEWPKIYRMDYGQEEAAAIQGSDPRQYLTSASEFIGDDEGKVKSMMVHNIKWISENGRFTPQKVEGTEREIPADLVLLAMGFLGPEETIVEKLGLETDPRSNVKADEGQYATSVPGVFAAGDMRRGQSLIVWAIKEGRGAAREADRYLMGSTRLP